MLWYIMLYVMLAYLMLLAVLSNAVCLYDGFFFWGGFLLLIFANASCFMLCLGLLTQFVYFKYNFSLCALLLIWSSLLNLCTPFF